MESKVKYLNFAITKAINNIFCQNKAFSEYGHVAYQIKADEAGSNMVVNILSTDTPSTQAVGSKGQTISFSESSHVAYQIKADEAGSIMVAIILPTDTPSTQGVGSKGQTISFFWK